MTDSPDPVPAPLRLAAILAGAQGVVTLGIGLGEALHIQAERWVMGSTTALFFVLYGAALLLCAWGLWSARTWARGPVLFAQLVWLGLAWSFRDGDTLWLAVGLAASAVLALAALLHPRSLSVLDR